MSNLLPEAVTASGGWDGYMEISKNRARVDGLLEVVPSINLDASESVTVEERRRAWILIYSVTTRMPVNGSN